MRLSNRFVCTTLAAVAAAALPTSGCREPAKDPPIQREARPRFETSVDGAGCVVEHVATEPGTNQFQYDGLSPDGSTMAVGWSRGDAERGLYLLDLATGERTEMAGLNEVAVFAPSGDMLLATVYVDDGRTDLFEVDPANGERSVVAPHEAWDWLGSYSSDGATIVFNSYRAGASDIYTYRRDSGELERWTDDPRYEAYAQFSPDDSSILFHRQVEGGNYDLFVIDVASGEISQLTQDETEEGYGSWSPDGESIVFASDRGQAAGITDLYLMRADGTGIRRLTAHPAKDSHPFFSPDGRYLYFNSGREPAGIYRIEMEEGFECRKASE